MRYVEVGGDPARFWGLSPRLYVAEMAGFRARMELAEKQRLTLAWTTAALHRSDKMPQLNHLLNPLPPPSPQDVSRRLAALSLPVVTLAEWRSRRELMGGA